MIEPRDTSCCTCNLVTGLSIFIPLVKLVFLLPFQCNSKDLKRLESAGVMLAGSGSMIVEFATELDTAYGFSWDLVEDVEFTVDEGRADHYTNYFKGKFNQLDMMPSNFRGNLAALGKSLSY